MSEQVTLNVVPDELDLDHWTWEDFDDASGLIDALVKKVSIDAVKLFLSEMTESFHCILFDVDGELSVSLMDGLSVTFDLNQAIEQYIQEDPYDGLEVAPLLRRLADKIEAAKPQGAA